MSATGKQDERPKGDLERPRTPFERVKACPRQTRSTWPDSSQLRRSLDPFQLGRAIERKLERIGRLANRRLSPKCPKKDSKIGLEFPLQMCKTTWSEFWGACQFVS